MCQPLVAMDNLVARVQSIILVAHMVKEKK
jgi:hypothetical protein